MERVKQKQQQRKLVKLRRVIKNPVTGENITQELNREETAADMIMRGDSTWKRVDKPMERKPVSPKVSPKEPVDMGMVDTASQEKEKAKFAEMPIGEVMKLIKETEDGETLYRLSQDERPRVRAEAKKRATSLNIEFN